MGAFNHDPNTTGKPNYEKRKPSVSSPAEITSDDVINLSGVAGATVTAALNAVAAGAALRCYPEIVMGGLKTVFTMPVPYTPGANRMLVIKQGIVQSVLHGDFVETDANTVTMSDPVVGGTIIQFFYW